MPFTAALSPFAALPDSSRLWLLALDQPSSAELLAPDMEALMGRWRHKGVQYEGAWTLLERHILAVAEPSMATNPSGCAIDGMLRGVQQIITRAGLGLADPSAVLVRLGDGLRVIPRADLESRLQDGTLEAATPVLDLALLTLGDLRHGKFERPLAATWIGRKFRLAAGVAAGL